MKRLIQISFLWFLIAGCESNETKQQANTVQWYLTTPDRNSLMTSKSEISFQKESTQSITIVVDTTQQFQTVDGFGYTLTGGSAQLINGLPNAKKDTLLRELFTTDNNGLGISFLRISIGSSDLDDHVFSYDDLTSGTDTGLQNFSMAEDEKNLIPVLKKIIALDPTIKILGSPWSAPAWMKDNNSTKGGSLKSEYYPVYAQYFVKYLQYMKDQGIVLHSITIQNEPENPNNNPSMVMTSGQQAEFIKTHLGPALVAANLETKIVLFDHNCDHPNYPIEILNDSEARKFVDGSAFHMYLGEVSAIGSVHAAYPEKNVYFTEQWTSGDGQFGGDLNWHIKTLMVGAMRNWSRTVLEWNLAADPQLKPHTVGGCDKCLGALTISNSITRNVSYYIVGHASKWVRPGSIRIFSSVQLELSNVAFITPSGNRVMIVQNDSQQSQSFQIKDGSRYAVCQLPAGAVATYSWR